MARIGRIVVPGFPHHASAAAASASLSNNSATRPMRSPAMGE
jgi:hypothetical protein